MLGEIIFENKGKIIGQRVKSIEDGIPKLEITATGSGTVIRNFKANETWTYWTIRKRDGCFCCGG
jgi:hypothetical protein